MTSSGAVRILGGRWKGRALEVPAQARPTAARAREALFDVLSRRLEGSRVLDLFAGSGALGLEAVSRGAAACVLVDRDDGALRRTLERLGATRQEARSLRGAAAGAVEDLLRAGETFDLIFADPPYVGGAVAPLPAHVRTLLAPGGLLVVQADRGAEVPATEGLRLLDKRAYGRNVFHLFGMH
jgi:16S rRNA (guanine966-N2)-methyltransferase